MSEATEPHSESEGESDLGVSENEKAMWSSDLAFYLIQGPDSDIPYDKSNGEARQAMQGYSPAITRAY